MSTPLRAILFVSTIESHWGGSEVLWSQAALALCARGNEVAAFFTYYKDLPPTRALQSAGVSLHFGTPSPTRWWKRIGNRPLNRLGRLREVLDAKTPDLVVFNQGDVIDGQDAMQLCRERRQPYAIISQAVGPLFYCDRDWETLRAGFGGAAYTWFVSRENQIALLDSINASPERTEVIPNAYGCAYSIDCPWPVSSEPLRLASVGRLDVEQKGQDILLAVLAREKWRQRPLHVSFFGTGPCENSLKERARHLCLTSVHFAGQTHDIQSMWREHHALVMSSRYEGQSLAMIEAMLHGRPVISTPVGGTADVVIDGHTGFLSKHIDADSFDEALEHAWTHRAHWEQLGRNARTHIGGIVSPSPGADFANRLEALWGAAK